MPFAAFCCKVCFAYMASVRLVISKQIGGLHATTFSRSVNGALNLAQMFSQMVIKDVCQHRRRSVRGDQYCDTAGDRGLKLPENDAHNGACSGCYAIDDCCTQVGTHQLKRRQKRP